MTGSATRWCVICDGQTASIVCIALPKLEGEVECDEVYVVAGHKGHWEAVRNGERPPSSFEGIAGSRHLGQREASHFWEISRDSRQHDGGSLVVAAKLATTAPRYFAGTPAALPRLFRVHSQPMPTRKRTVRVTHRYTGKTVCLVAE